MGDRLKERIGKTIMDNRAWIRPRKCWWVNWCPHERTSSEFVYLSERPGKNYSVLIVIPSRTWTASYTIEVTEEEATETGKGHPCPICGNKNGSYICDGFPTFSATTVLPIQKEADYE